MLGYDLNEIRFHPLDFRNEPVGVTRGTLLAAPRNAGLATLTPTPNPMFFINEILKRPKN